ncbi:MAG: NYN domain-containing protein [Chloroflexaceae bacterium]|nr:NYN domain-containing protein [Chloroflexaceae bacterium]
MNIFRSDGSRATDLTASGSRKSLSAEAAHKAIKKLELEKTSPQFRAIDRGRIAIFIDGQSLLYAAWQLGIEIDYLRLLRCLTAEARLLRPFFYTGVDPANDKQNSFLLWLARNGYRVVSKDLIQFADGSKKADLNVEISVDMLTLVPYYDTAILVSGDGDLAYAVDAVSYKGVRVEIVGLRSMTSDRLINYADCYIDLEDIKDGIQKVTSPTYFSNAD